MRCNYCANTHDEPQPFCTEVWGDPREASRSEMQEAEQGRERITIRPVEMPAYIMPPEDFL